MGYSGRGGEKEAERESGGGGGNRGRAAASGQQHIGSSNMNGVES
jgi:hypothetical protein